MDEMDLKVYIGWTHHNCYKVLVKDDVWHKTTLISFTKWGARRKVRQWAKQRGVTNPITFIYY